MVVDTGTVRLVIFIGMFLVFAGDYTTLINSVFGNGMVAGNSTFGGLHNSKDGGHSGRLSMITGMKDIPEDGESEINNYNNRW